jgi:hypothetical protein
LPRAFTFDIETLTLLIFVNVLVRNLSVHFGSATLRLEQQQRYLDDIAAEEERC